MEEPSRKEKEMVLELLQDEVFCFNWFLGKSKGLKRLTKNQFLTTLYWLEAKKYVYRLPGNEHEYCLTKRGQAWHDTYLKEYQEEVFIGLSYLLMRSENNFKE
ncbi:DUF3116 family protein [Listeria aquatica]|uniref:DUF3116 family protein n=1 Tax=Listeria aquatica TaxID=1494960 RepID=A0A841ZKW3_9LIST|nr:DUF3116 family protein [Listeria aquatica]MBC1520743.1 DUF3116 family protein [Listeria aquatica]